MRARALPPSSTSPSRTAPPAARPRGRTSDGASHGDWEPAARRRDPVELLEEQAETRVPELVPIRYGRMLVSPFTFYRGAAYLMAADLASEPRTGLHVQLCGDAHLSNFGVFAAPGPAAGLQRQRLRRDAARARSSGTSSGSSRASPSPDATAASTPSSARRSTSPSARAYRERDARASRSMRKLDALVRPPRRRRDRRALGGAGERQGRRKRFEQNVAKARAKDSLTRASTSSRTWSTASRGSSSDPPLIVPIEDRCAERARSGRSVHARDHPLVPPNTVGRSPAACWSASATSMRRARSSGSAASARARGSCCCSAATTRTRCSCRSRRRRRRCSSRSSAPARSPTTASASSRASG